jgi:mannose-6-phosphate isomerase-like protein (cupin superfamily)
MHHFSQEYDENLSYSRNAAGAMVQGQMVRTKKERSSSMDTINVTRANEGEHWLVVTDVTTIKASGANTSGKLLVLEVEVPPGGGPPVHHRHEYSEVFLFQEGEFEVSTVDENCAPSTVRVGAGDTVSIPSMAWHNFRNVGETPGKFTAVHSPAVMEEFMREIGRPISDPRQLPASEGPPSDQDMQRMMDIIGRYMEMLPPERIGR